MIALLRMILIRFVIKFKYFLFDSDFDNCKSSNSLISGARNCVGFEPNIISDGANTKFNLEYIGYFRNNRMYMNLIMIVV